MTNTRAAHFGRAIRLTIEYGNELEQLHHRYHTELRNELSGSGMDDNIIENYLHCIRNELFFSIHGFKYVQQLVEVMDKEGVKEV